MNESFPVLTSELTTQIEACIVSFSERKSLTLRSLPGNPYGVNMRSFGHATAFLTQHTHNSELFNHVGNIRESDISYLDEIITWYQNHGIRCSFDIIPSHASPQFLWNLAARGFYQSGFYNTLYGLPNTTPHSSSEITVRAVSAEEREIFANVYLESFDVPRTETYSYVRESVRILVGMPETHCLFALIDASVAAIGVLYIYQQIGYLALAATLPAFRGSGCQRALLQARMALAEQTGCVLVTSQAGVATTSHHNIERIGLRLAYTKVQWSPFDPQKQPDQRDPVDR